MITSENLVTIILMFVLAIFVEKYYVSRTGILLNLFILLFFACAEMGQPTSGNTVLVRHRCYNWSNRDCELYKKDTVRISLHLSNILLAL